MINKKKILYFIAEFSSVYVLQIVNILFPILIIPLLIRSLGEEDYGVLSVHQAIVMIAMVVVDFSFNYSATREISSVAENKDHVNEIFWKYTYTKITILGFVFVLLAVATLTEAVNGLLILTLCPMLIGTVLFPIWFFQGTGQMRKVAFAHVTSKIIIFIVMALVLSIESSIYLAAALIGSVYLVSGFLAVMQIAKYDYIKVTRFSISESLETIKGSAALFSGLASTTLYVHSGLLLVGFAADKSGVGYFAVGSKLKNGVSNLAHPVSQVLFHRISRSFKKSNRFPKIGFQAIVVQFCLALAAFVVFLFGSDYITYFFTGTNDSVAHDLVFILVLGGFIQMLKNVLFIQVFSATGEDSKFRNYSFAQLPLMLLILAANHYLFDFAFVITVARSLLLTDLVFFLFLSFSSILYISKLNSSPRVSNSEL